MNISGANVPAQAAAFLSGTHKVDTYETTGGRVTSQFAAHNLTLIPAIPSGSVIHDNASGSGTVSRRILASPDAPSDLTIHATDIDQPFLDILSADVKANNWPISVSNQRSETTDFPDATFTHSIANISIFFTSTAGLDGAREIYRILKPGGLAVVNCWESVSWLMPVKKVHMKFRSEHPFPAPTTNWADGQQLQRVMHDAGFAPENCRVGKSEAWAVVKPGDFGGHGFRGWAERMWAYLAGVAGWFPGDEEMWDEQIDYLVEVLKGAEGVVEADGEVRLRASQWVVVATK